MNGPSPDIIAERCACWRCYGELVVEGGIVSCPTCGQAGFIRKTTVYRMRQEAPRKVKEIMRNMPDLFPKAETTRKSVEKALSELGF